MVHHLQHAAPAVQQDDPSWQHEETEQHEPQSDAQQEAQSPPQQEPQAPHEEHPPEPQAQLAQAHESPQQHAAAALCDRVAAPAAKIPPASRTSAEPIIPNRFISGSFPGEWIVGVGVAGHTPAAGAMAGAGAAPA